MLPAKVSQSTMAAQRCGVLIQPLKLSMLTMRLVAQGQVELDAPLRRYIPELRRKNERAAAEITVLNLLNHTAGLDWALLIDTGGGDDALAAYVARLDELKLITPPGTRASY